MALNIILWPVLFPARCAASIVLFLSSEWRIETLLICMFLVFSVNFQRQNDWAGCSLVYRIAQVKANAEYHCRTLLNKALQAPVSVMQRRACLAEALKRRATR